MAFSQYDRGSGFTTTGSVYSTYAEFELNKSANQIDPGATVVVAFVTKYLSNPQTVTVRDPAANTYHKIAERRRIVYSSPGVVDQTQSFELRVYACNVTNSIAQSDEIFVRFPGGYPASGFLYTISEYRGTSNVSWTVTEHAPNGGFSNDGSGSSATNSAASTENEISDTDWIWFAVTAIWDSSSTSITDPSGFTRAVTAGKSGESRMWVYHDFTPAGTTNQTFTATFGGTQTWAMTAFALRQSPNFNYSSVSEPGAALTGTAQITGFSTGPTAVIGAGAVVASSTLAATAQLKVSSQASASLIGAALPQLSAVTATVSTAATLSAANPQISAVGQTVATIGSSCTATVGAASVVSAASLAATASQIGATVAATVSSTGLVSARITAFASLDGISFASTVAQIATNSVSVSSLQSSTSARLEVAAASQSALTLSGVVKSTAFASGLAQTALSLSGVLQFRGIAAASAAATCGAGATSTGPQSGTGTASAQCLGAVLARVNSVADVIGVSSAAALSSFVPTAAAAAALAAQTNALVGIAGAATAAAVASATNFASYDLVAAPCRTSEVTSTRLAQVTRNRSDTVVQPTRGHKVYSARSSAVLAEDRRKVGRC